MRKLVYLLALLGLLAGSSGCVIHRGGGGYDHGYYGHGHGYGDRWDRY